MDLHLLADGLFFLVWFAYLSTDCTFEIRTEKKLNA